MEHLIADSGIQFITKEIEFNPSEPLLLQRGGTLKYSFIETEDFLEGFRIFNLLYYNKNIDKYIPVDELSADDSALLRHPNGREELDEAGMVIMDDNANASLFTTYDENEEGLYSINSLLSYRVDDLQNPHTKVSAFELLLDKWLPMPMFRKEIDGVTTNTPLAWCRMKIQKIGEADKKGAARYRVIWAFDTQSGDDEWSVLRPFIAEEDNGFCEYRLCNRADLLLEFLSSNEEFHAFSDYLASILGINLDKEDTRKYKAYYIYFINFIRLVGGAPEVTLHDNKQKSINVDLVLDIGNSKTCGILFEDGKFTNGKMLELTDLSNPWLYYENKTFDMRVVFRKADFGNDIVLDEEMFQWKSFVRIGEEARRLVYRSLEEEGLAEKTTNYSSPKRYLWDSKEYEGQWENLITTEDPFNVLLSNEISVPGLSTLFDKDGSYAPNGNGEVSNLIDLDQSEHHYSRSSLMTFAFIEIFQHAITQINSVRYRDKWGNKDIRRNLRNVVITCPTAMPLREQCYLRKSAENALAAIVGCNQKIQMPTVTPDPEKLKVTDPYAPLEKKVWRYDEASCCQLVYLYAEIAQRYNGEINKFFDLKGQVRPEDKKEGNNNNTLTIGTVDIGAGTTDIMICKYDYQGAGTGKTTPIPLFWDSFYLAGDDILRNIVQNIVIEGKDHGLADFGNISAALTARIKNMSDQDLKSLPCIDNVVYKNKIFDIISTIDENEKQEKKTVFASNLVHDFFGNDSSMMGYRDRRCRVDFNTQISVPVAQRMMELLRTHRPSKVYTYDELFDDMKPASYLLDYFYHHFGFRFEELSWRFDPIAVADIVKTTMEPLMKQLALVFYTQQCDIIVLAGRPTSLDPINELFIKYVPTSPDRLIRLNGYRVGNWCPTADGQGYFYDQKAIVAVGGMIGYHASHTGLLGLTIDFSKMIEKMNSTANYIGAYNSRRRQVTEVLLSPTVTTAEMDISVFPAFLGCRQLDSVVYQARPLYAIYNHGSANRVQVRVSRNFTDNKEELVLEEATDSEYRNVKKDIELVQQSLVDDGKFWLDKGEFELTIK